MREEKSLNTCIFKKARRKDENRVCSTKGCCINRQHEAWSIHLLTCQPKLTKSPCAPCKKPASLLTNISENGILHNPLSLSRKKSHESPATFPLVDISIGAAQEFPGRGAGDGSQPGLAPVLVHMQVPVHLQFTHTLMFFKRHLISSGLRLFRTEGRSVACHQYNICPPPSPLFIPATCIQKSLSELAPQHLNLQWVSTPCVDPRQVIIRLFALIQQRFLS